MKERKKYLLIGDANSPHLYKWYKELQKYYQVHVLTFPNVERYKYSSITSFGLSIQEKGGNIHVLKIFLKLCAEIRRISPDIINAHYVTSYGFLSSLAVLLFRRPLVVSAWGSDILVTPRKSIFHNILTKFTLKRATLITSDSLVMTERVEELVADVKVLTFPMGINKEQVYEGTDKGCVFTFLSLRALVPNSNVQDIVSAFDSVASQFENVELVVANTGSEEEAIKKVVSFLPSKSKICFVGLLAPEELARVMKSANAYITVPTSDSLSVSLLEAMASELLIIASDLPANREFVSKECGWLIDRGVEPLVGAMKDVLLLSEEEKKRSYKCCKDIVMRKAIWKDAISDYVTQLHDIA